MPARTRFAPSPTGSLHVGGVRTALYCLLHARHTGGRFLIRIEDTDQARSTEQSTRDLLRDLEWLGLDWDEGPGRDGGHGPYLQSQRLAIYHRYLQQLLDSGHAYLAWETREELTSMREAARAARQDWHYRRQDYTGEELARFQAEGRTPVVRLAHPRRDITVHDEILGDVTVTEEELEDIVIRKADGFPTYHFAVVVDDHLMEITQVLRGTEHLRNTHKHVGIMEALGWSMPRFGHMPTINNPGGSKMSKRDKAKAARTAARAARDEHQRAGRDASSWAWLAETAGVDEVELTLFMKKKSDRIDIAEALAAALDIDLPMIEVMDFRKAGYLPEALINYLVLLGWSPGDDREIMTLDEMIEAFTLDRVGRTSARFDPDKLQWMNGEYIRSLPEETVLARMDQWMEVAETALAALAPEQRLALFRMYRPRVSTLAEIEQQGWFFLQRPAEWQEKAIQKHIRKGGGADHLRAAREALSGLESWTAEEVEEAVQVLAEEREVRMGKIAQPLRVAVSGGPVSPAIGETLAYLGQEEVLARVDACLAAL